MAAIMSDLLDKLDVLVPEVLAFENVPGASVAVVHEGDVVWSYDYGTTRAGGECDVSDATVFQAASLSKPVFAYAVMKLIEKGKLDLDEPLDRYLPEHYAVDDERIHKVTSRHVLSHCTGFPNWRGNNSLDIQFEPGERFQYSGEGYGYLSMVIESITGDQIADWLRQSVLSPCRMPKSDFAWRDEYEYSAATGHGWDRLPVEIAWRGAGPHVAMSLLSTAVEYARFLGIVLTPPAPDDHLMETETIDRMLAPQIHVEDSISWSLGWGVDTKNEQITIWHWGDNPGFKCFCAGSVQTQTGDVVMTNSAYGLRACKDIIGSVMGRRYAPFAATMLRSY